LVHSLFDYPLRTSAMMAVAAFACALLVAPLTARGGAEDAPRPRGDQKPPRSERERTGFGPPTGDGGPDIALSTPKPREAWGQSIEWPEAWRKPPSKKDR